MTLHRAGTFFKRHVRHTELHADKQQQQQQQQQTIQHRKSSPLRTSSRDSFAEPVAPQSMDTPASNGSDICGEDGKPRTPSSLTKPGSLVQPLVSSSSSQQELLLLGTKKNSSRNGNNKKKPKNKSAKRQSRLLPKIFSLRKSQKDSDVEFDDVTADLSNRIDSDETLLSYSTDDVSTAKTSSMSASPELESVRQKLITSGEIACRLQADKRQGDDVYDAALLAHMEEEEGEHNVDVVKVNDDEDIYTATPQQHQEQQQGFTDNTQAYDPSVPRKKTMRQIEKEWPRLSPEQRMERVVTQNYNEVLYSIAVVFDTRRDYYSLMNPDQRLLIQELEKECWILEERAEQIRERGWTTNEEMKEMQGYLWGLKCDVLVNFAPLWRWNLSSPKRYLSNTNTTLQNRCESPDLWSSATEGSFAPTTAVVISPAASGKRRVMGADGRRNLEDSFSTVVLETSDSDDSDDFEFSEDESEDEATNDNDSCSTVSYDSWLHV